MSASMPSERCTEPVPDLGAHATTGLIAILHGERAEVRD